MIYKSATPIVDEFYAPRVLVDAAIQPQPVRDFLTGKPAAGDDLLEGVITGGCNTVVVVEPGLEDAAQRFATILACSAAMGTPIAPFGHMRMSSTLLALGRRKQLLDSERIELMRERGATPVVRRRLDRCLHVSERNPRSAVYLNTSARQRMFLDHTPEDCELVVFAPVNGWLRIPGKGDTATTYSHEPVQVLINALNARRSATVCFVHGGRKGLEALASELDFDNCAHFIELTKDAAAPTEYGGGFNVVRRRTSEHAELPLRFQFWMLIKDGKLDFGWECRDPQDGLTAKAVEIAERQKKVARMLAMNIPQKEIAKAIGVDPATISRDVAAIKRRAASADRGALVVDVDC